MPPSQVANAVASRTSSPLSGTTVAATLTNVVGSGNAVYGGCSWDASVVSAITSVTDDKGNSYTVLDNTLDGTNNQRAAQFYRKNITNGPKTVTVTFSGGSPGARTIVVAEFTGVDTADQSNDGHGGQNQQLIGTTANAITSGAITTTLDGDLILGLSANTSGSPGPPNVGTGFTSGDADNTSPGSCADIRLEWLVQTSHGSKAATFTNTSGTQAFTSLVAALKAASSGTNVNLVAAAGTGAVAGLSPSLTAALVGASATGAPAALVASLAKTLAGGSAAGAVAALALSLEAFFTGAAGSGVAASAVPSNRTSLAAIAAAAASEGLLPQLATPLVAALASGAEAGFSPALTKTLGPASATAAAVALQASLAIIVNLVAASASAGEETLTPAIATALAEAAATGAAGTVTANLGGFVNLVAAAALAQPGALAPALAAFVAAAAATGHAAVLVPSLATLVALAAAAAAATASGLTPAAVFDIGSVAGTARAEPLGPAVSLDLGALAATSRAAAVLIEVFFGLAGVGGLGAVENLAAQGSVVAVPLAAVEAAAAAAGFSVIVTMTARVILVDDRLNVTTLGRDQLLSPSEIVNDLLVGTALRNDRLG